MNSKLINSLLLLGLSATTYQVSAQERCVVSGDSLSQARSNYAEQCNVQRVDCDPFNGIWYCASFNITSSTPPALTLAQSPVAETPITSPTPPEPISQPTPAPVVPEPVAPSTPIESPVAEAQPEPTPPAEQIETPVVTTPPVDAPVVSTRPSCVSANSDPDGDGFGWENERTCLVDSSSAAATSTPIESPVAEAQPAPTPPAEQIETPVVTTPTVAAPVEPVAPSPVTPANETVAAVRPVCAFADSDSDGDGFGFENNQTCLVAAASAVTEVPEPAIEAPVVEEVAEAPVVQEQPVVQPAGSAANNSTRDTDVFASAITAADITDLILVTGQSNALGAGTSYNANLDQPNSRVFAFTNNGWQVASLRQIWDRNWFPRTDPHTDPSNNFSLHFGREVAENDSSRVIGFVLASAPGAAIASWDIDSGDFYPSLEAKALEAINQLPHKSAIDGILWHQGETDGRDEQFYTDALNDVISNMRNEAWVQNNAPFICGETKIPAVNNRLNMLNTDSDPNTACVRAIDLPDLGDDRHFNAEGLRILGARYGEAYLDIVN